MAATLPSKPASAHVFTSPPSPPADAPRKPNTHGWYTRSNSRCGELVGAKQKNEEEPVSCPPFEEDEDDD